MSAKRYFLHVRINGELIEDPEGVMLLHIEEARAHAVAAALELMAEGLLDGTLTPDCGFELVDEHGNLRDVMPFYTLLRTVN